MNFYSIFYKEKWNLIKFLPFYWFFVHRKKTRTTVVMFFPPCRGKLQKHLKRKKVFVEMRECSWKSVEENEKSAHEKEKECSLVL